MQKQYKYSKCYKTRNTVRRNLAELRAIIDDTETPPELARIACGMETALRWVTQKTVGWGGMAQEARDLAELLKKEMAKSEVKAETPGGSNGQAD